MRHELFAADSLEPDDFRPVTVDGATVIVVRKYDGEFRALDDRCPHCGEPLSHGSLQRAVEGDDVGELRLSKRVELKCPGNGLRFDVDTGLGYADPDHAAVRVYPVTVEDGIVVMDR